MWRQRVHNLAPASRKRNAILRGARCALSPQESAYCCIQIDSGKIARIATSIPLPDNMQAEHIDIDLTGFLILPGLVNAHDHLQFALYPKLGGTRYNNYVEWGEDIHQNFADVIATQHLVPKAVRLCWGGIRNLLCGVTTVCHHDPLWPELRLEDFPVRVVQHYGWGHSLALGGDLLKAHQATPSGAVFILHACEGVDTQAQRELHQLDQLGLLDENTVLVHGLALDEAGIDLLQRRGVSLIACPSSNDFLYQKLPSMDLLARINHLSLGNDSPLTAAGDLLDEIRFAIEHCEIRPEKAYAMVTEAPAAVLRLPEQAGTIQEGGVGDLVAVRDTGRSPAGTLQSLSIQDVELVMLSGRVQLASDAVRKSLPALAVDSLEPLWIDGALRWLRAPVHDLLQQAESALGVGQVRLGGRELRSATADLLKER